MEPRDFWKPQEGSGRVEAIKTLGKILDEFTDLTQGAVQGEYVDLRGSAAEEVKSFLVELERSGKFVFHSNSTKEMISELQPKEAVDNETMENSMNAVFASPRYLEALAYGVLHKFNLSKIWKGFAMTVGHNEAEGVSIKLDRAVIETLQANEDEYLQNVLLYVLEKSGFQDVPNREGEEYYSTDRVAPLLTLNVPKEVAVNGIQFKPFSDEEMQKITPAERRTV